MADGFDRIKAAAETAAIIGRFDVAVELLDRYRMSLLGSFWCEAEGNSASWNQLTDEAQEQIHNRIRQQETKSPGDLAVQAIRLLQELRDVDETPSWLLQRFADLDHKKGARLQRLHVYDSFTFDGRCTSENFWVRLFGGANIGYDQLTNLRVAGQLSSGPALLTRFYVTTVPSLETLPGIYTLDVHGKRIETALAHQLLVRPQPLDVYVAEHEQIRVDYNYRPPDISSVVPPNGTLIYVHIEGWSWVEVY